MPRKREWTGRTPQAVEILEKCEGELIYTQDLRQVLDVSLRTAGKIMEEAGAWKIGPAWAIQRTTLIQFLRRWVDTPQVKQRRHTAVVVQQCYEERHMRRISVRVPDVAAQRVDLFDFGGLPEGVTITPGRVVIDCSSPTDFIFKAHLLSKAMTSNWEEFERRVKRDNSQLPFAEKVMAVGA